MCGVPPPTYLCVNSKLSLAQLVSPSVALPAKLVSHFFPSSNFLIEGLLETKIYLSKVNWST